MGISARALFGITLEGVSKDVIIPKLELLKYTVPLDPKTLGEQDRDPNYIMCESIVTDITAIGNYPNTLHRIKGITQVDILQVEPIIESKYHYMIPLLISIAISLLTTYLLLVDFNELLGRFNSELNWFAYLRYLAIPAIVSFLIGIFYLHFKQGP